jgi:hypothetical protein
VQSFVIFNINFLLLLGICVCLMMSVWKLDWNCEREMNILLSLLSCALSYHKVPIISQQSQFSQQKRLVHFILLRRDLTHTT